MRDTELEKPSTPHHPAEKAVRLRKNDKIELYFLADDLGEAHDVVEEFPGIVASMAGLFETARTGSEYFPLGRSPE